jgi:integrase
MQLAPRTLDQDQWSAGLIREGLGGHRLAALTVDDVDRFLVAAASGEYGRPMARPQLRRLRQKVIRIIENDQRRGLVGRNVAELSIVPEESPELVGRRPPRALSREELARLLHSAEGVVAVALDLSGRNGLRPAEARALRWSNVNLERKTLRVEAQMNRKNEIVQVKTRRSARTIGFDEATLERLMTWGDEQKGQARDAGPAWSGNPSGLILTTLFGTAVNQRNMHRSLATLCDKTGVSPRISAYDLRHSAITFQVVNGHPAYRVADWAGTSERMIADVYRHKLDPVSDLGSVEG